MLLQPGTYEAIESKSKNLYNSIINSIKVFEIVGCFEIKLLPVLIDSGNAMSLTSIKLLKKTPAFNKDRSEKLLP